MATTHRGNLLNEITFEEHDGTNNAKRVNIVAGTLTGGQATVTLYSTPTLFAVVNTAAAAQASVVLDNSISKIGFATVAIGSGNVGITGNVTISDSKGFIGLTTAVNGQAWPDPKTYIGLVTIGHTPNVAVVGNVTLSDAKTYIGLATITIGSGVDQIIGPGTVSGIFTSTASGTALNVILRNNNGVPYNLITAGDNDAGNNGLIATGRTQVFNGTTWERVRTALASNATGQGMLAAAMMAYDGTAFHALNANTSGAAWQVNAGTQKTILSLPIGFSVASITTIAVPTNANRIKVTNLLLNSDATVNIRLKSGVTYLTGNASIGVTLNPGGGWAMPGSPDSPSWLGLPSGALVVEKFDMTATAAKIGGQVLYFDEV